MQREGKLITITVTILAILFPVCFLYPSPAWLFWVTPGKLLELHVLPEGQADQENKWNPYTVQVLFLSLTDSLFEIKSDQSQRSKY